MITYSTLITLSRPTVPYLDVRCRHCSKLLVRWANSGTATLEAKCPRCSKVSTIHLST